MHCVAHTSSWFLKRFNLCLSKLKSRWEQTPKWTQTLRTHTDCCMQTHTHTHYTSMVWVGQADWNYQARPRVFSSNFQHKQILDATVISPFNTDQESSWHICSLTMSQFQRDLCTHRTHSFYVVSTEGDTTFCLQNLLKKKEWTNEKLSKLMQLSFEAKICICIPIPFHTENFNFRHIYKTLGERDVLFIL